MRHLADWLRDPELAGIDVDAQDRITVHANTLARKQLLREVFSEFHHLFESLDRQHFSASGIRLEIGAGVAPIRNSYPDVLATDIVPAPGLDRVLNAEDMALDDASVRVVFGQNCFHHFPHPELFFAELDRVLAAGGGAVLLEPFHGPAAAFLYPRLFRTEGYDKQFPSWNVPATGPMNGANQALSYIVFERDRAQFERKFPRLKIVRQAPCGNYLKYLLSGGLNFRQLAPDWSASGITAVQRLLSPMNRWLALHHVIVLRKQET